MFIRLVPRVQAVSHKGHQAMMPAPETSLTRVEDYHVPAGHLAVTVDFAPMPPSTVAIEATKLVDGTASIWRLATSLTVPYLRGSTRTFAD